MTVLRNALNKHEKEAAQAAEEKQQRKDKHQAWLDSFEQKRKDTCSAELSKIFNELTNDLYITEHAISHGGYLNLRIGGNNFNGDGWKNPFGIFNQDVGIVKEEDIIQHESFKAYQAKLAKHGVQAKIAPIYNGDTGSCSTFARSTIIAGYVVTPILAAHANPVALGTGAIALFAHLKAHSGAVKLQLTFEETPNGRKSMQPEPPIK